MAHTNVFEIGAELGPFTKEEINTAFALLMDGYAALKRAQDILINTRYVQKQTRDQIADRFDAAATLIDVQVAILKEWASEDGELRDDETEDEYEERRTLQETKQHNS